MRVIVKSLAKGQVSPSKKGGYCKRGGMDFYL
jgi:hypothetical protein